MAQILKLEWTGRNRFIRLPINYDQIDKAEIDSVTSYRETLVPILSQIPIIVISHHEE